MSGHVIVAQAVCSTLHARWSKSAHALGHRIRKKEKCATRISVRLCALASSSVKSLLHPAIRSSASPQSARVGACMGSTSRRPCCTWTCWACPGPLWRRPPPKHTSSPVNEERHEAHAADTNRERLTAERRLALLHKMPHLRRARHGGHHSTGNKSVWPAQASRSSTALTAIRALAAPPTGALRRQHLPPRWMPLLQRPAPDRPVVSTPALFGGARDADSAANPAAPATCHPSTTSATAGLPMETDVRGEGKGRGQLDAPRKPA